MVLLFFHKKSVFSIVGILNLKIQKMFLRIEFFKYEMSKDINSFNLSRNPHQIEHMS